MAVELPKAESEWKFDSEVLEERFFAALSYFVFLCFIPLLLKKESRFAQFHGKQGLILFILEAAAGILSATPVLGNVISILSFGALIILSSIGMVKALRGESWPMPGVYDLASKISL